MPLFAGWFRHQRHHQSKDPTAAGVEGPSISSPSGGLSRLASLTRARLLRSDAAEHSASSHECTDILSTQSRRGSTSQVHPERSREQPRSHRNRSTPRLPADPHEHAASWSQLPDEALELIFACLIPDPTTSDAAALRRREAMYNVTAVCKAWRRVGLYCFFRNLSASLPQVAHALQLFRLSTSSMMGSMTWRKPDSGLMECYVKRICQETVCVRPGSFQVVTKFMLFCGTNCRDPRKSKYLLTARLSTRTETTIFYDKDCHVPSARVSSNMLGTRYTLDLAPGIHKAFEREEAWGNHAFLDGCGLPLPGKRAAEVLYKTRLKGFMKPRRMRLVLPAVGEQAPRTASSPLALSSPLNSGPSRCMTDSLTDEADAGDLFAETLQGPNLGPEQEPERRQSAFASLMESIGLHTLNTNLMTTTANLANVASCGLFRDRVVREEDEGDVMATQRLGANSSSMTMVNKAPHWNEQLRCWCLNFKGRVKLASVKNFQLVCENDMQTIVMQFGKVDGDHYILDFQPTVISAVQAFAVALSTFDTKVLL